MSSLTGQRVVVTRAAHQADELAAPLRALGAQVILLPAISIAPPLDPAPLRDAAANCDRYDWILFTSANAIDAFVSEFAGDSAECQARIATVGAATREAAEQRGFTVSITPEKYVAESLVAAIGSEELQGRRVLIPSAAVTRDVVPTELRKRGACVDVIEAYRNVVPPGLASKAATVFRDPHPDWITFASSSAIENLIRFTGPEPLRHSKIASIGPITSQTARKHGLVIASEAAEHSVAGLVAALCRL